MNDLVEAENTQLQEKENTGELVKIDYVALAIEKGADLATIEKFMDLKERQDAIEAKKAYVAAMANFTANKPTIQRTKKAYNSNYAGLAETIEDIKDVLAGCGLSVSWKTSQEGNRISVTCCVTHILGHQECTTLSDEPDKSGSIKGIQAIASVVSYLERYTMYAILGLASKEMDNDGGAPVELITEEMSSLLDSKLEENEIDRKKFNSWLKRDLKVDSLDQVSMKAYKTVDARINSAIRAKNKEDKK